MSIQSNVLYRSLYLGVVLFFVVVEFSFLGVLLPKASAASDVFRSTTYELQAGQFTGSSYLLPLNNLLSIDYFTMITGPSNPVGSRGAGQDQVRVSADPHANFGSSTAADELQLVRGVATNDWIGTVTVIECLIACDTLGFELTEVVETSIAAGAANSLQTITDTLSMNHSTNTVPFGGRFGGGISTSDTNANSYAVTSGFKITKASTDELQFSRFGAETRAPAAATITTYVTKWGSTWNIQNVNVTGTNSGSGMDQVAHYNTTAITPASRRNTWVWGAGFTRNDGLGDGAFGQVVTLGDGVNQNITETAVAVGSELSQVSPGRDFQVYILENNALEVDFQFRTRGDQGGSSGYQELTQAVAPALNPETYDNSSGTVQYTEGQRAAVFYNTSAGNGQAYSRVGAWGLRHTADTTLAFYRAYAGQPLTGWFQSIDFGDIVFSNVETQQQSFRWRDDSVDVNSSGGWLETENVNLNPQAKNTDLRVRFRIANHGTTPEDAVRQYELQFSNKQGFDSCSSVNSWFGVSDSSSDAFDLYNSANITPDGELLTSAQLSNPDGFSFVTGEGRENADTTSPIGPLNAGAFTEVEYALRLTDDAVTGRTYCLRLFDSAGLTELDVYMTYPEITIDSMPIIASGLGEAGTFSSAVNGGWTTINFAGSYTSPVVVGLSNSHNGENGLVFESRNVSSTAAEMRLCESEGAASNGCDTHISETVGYMVIDAAIAATTDGIEAGTFTANGTADSNSVTTNYSGSFAATPYVFANVNSVNSSEVPIEVVISATSNTSFTAGICDHLQGNNDACDPTHGNETVGWVAIEPGNEPFEEQFRSGVTSIGNSTWTAVTFSPSFASTPVLLAASQTDNGAQDVEIDEGRSVTTSGAEIRFCEIDISDTCDSHANDDIAWLAIESGEFEFITSLDQDGYRIYENTNAITPTVAIAAENTATNNIDDGTILHIRTAIQTGNQSLASSSTSLKLQYGQGATCSAVSTWSDVGGIGSSEIWRGFNNAAPADGATVPSSLLDGGGSTLQSYEEVNASVSNPNFIAAGARGEWAWVLENNGAPNFTTYCFRVVLADGTAINYTRYPQITTSLGAPNLPPDVPTNLYQEKTSATSIVTGNPTNETEVVFRADAIDQNTNDFLELCVEVVEIGNSFTNTEIGCGTPQAYSETLYPCEPTGNALFEKYDGIAGTAITDLYADPDFPSNPNSNSTITGGLLESPIDIDDNFGGKVGALICPPQDGEYTFWVSGDDGTELRLSTDTDPANVSTIASVPGWSPVNDWTKYPEQQSAPVSLNAGQYYYIEGNYKEAAGGDHVQIGWTLPDTTVERPISDTHYSLPSETSAVSTIPGMTPSVTIEIDGLENGKQYHWQARVRDAGGLYSSWVSFGGNSETETDFSVDTVAPRGVVFDGTIQGADIEFNSGELDELSANWQKIDGAPPDEISGLSLWLDGSDVAANGIDPADDSPVTVWSDKSGNSNDINGTGGATFSAAEDAVAFNDTAQPFDDTYNRSGGNNNALSVYSVVQGNANTASNHVWYETTTPRVAPAENGFLGGGTTLSNNNFWSNHIVDTKIITAEYDSNGTSTAWLDREQEFQFSETQNFADSQRLVIGDDTTGGNQLESGEFVHEILAYNQNVSPSDRLDLWEYLECKWNMKDCSVTYDYSIGTSPGGVDVQDWTTTGAATEITASGLSLETSSIYYFNVRITDVAGNQTVVTSDGQQVAPTISFSTSTEGSGVLFNQLNDINNYTDTKSTVLTTSTNARNGYAVRAFATSELETVALDSIDMFDGGTYAFPDVWNPGDRGFGYTSNDALVNGSNKFNDAVCPGGGSGGPCFAPFSLFAPGDIVADNPGIVSGTPIEDEQFTITHRVVADETQATGIYQTTLIFQATANY
jgi:hypothetical protein